MTPPDRGGVTFDDLTPPYSTIVIDPPWHYSGFARGSGRYGKFAHSTEPAPIKAKPMPYASMTVDEIAAMPIKSLCAENCWVWLWTTSRYLPAAFRIGVEWGFAYRQIVVWRKTGTPSPFGGTVAPPHAEFLLLFAHGSPRVSGRAVSSVLEAPKQIVHSLKPAVFLDLVEATTPGPYLEMFARAPRLGWDSWGYGYEGAA